MTKFKGVTKPHNAGELQYKPAVTVTTKTGSRSGDLLGLSLELLAAQDGDPDVSESLYGLGTAYLKTRNAISAIKDNKELTDEARKSHAQRAFRESLADVRANRQKLARIQRQAEATRTAALAERTSILDARAKEDPEATAIMLETLRTLDPIIASTKLRQAAEVLGETTKESYPWLLVAARRAQKLGLEHPVHRTPLVSPEVAEFIETTFVNQSTLGTRYAREAEVAGMHEAIAKTTEKALCLAAEVWDFDGPLQAELLAVPADGAGA